MSRPVLSPSPCPCSRAVEFRVWVEAFLRSRFCSEQPSPSAPSPPSSADAAELPFLEQVPLPQLLPAKRRCCGTLLPLHIAPAPSLGCAHLRQVRGGVPKVSSRKHRGVPTPRQDGGLHPWAGWCRVSRTSQTQGSD